MEKSRIACNCFVVSAERRGTGAESLFIVGNTSSGIYFRLFVGGDFRRYGLFQRYLRDYYCDEHQAATYPFA